MKKLTEMKYMINKLLHALLTVSAASLPARQEQPETLNLYDEAHAGGTRQCSGDKLP